MLRVTDNDHGEITVTLHGEEIRGWSYASDQERRSKMLCAREFVEGWYQARKPKLNPYYKPDMKVQPAFVFEGGVMHVKQQGYGVENGCGSFAFCEDAFTWEHSDESPKSYAIISVCNDDMIFLRDHLNALFPTA